MEQATDKSGMDRRTLLGVSGLMIMGSQLVRGASANSAVRVGLLGCGGRGTADATSMSVNGGARIVALADLFPDRLEQAKKHFDEVAQKGGFAGIDPALMFRGSHAFEQIANSKEVDAVVVATPPYYHPQHLAAVVAAGKHVYCEKPVAVDVPGAKHVLEIGKQAEGKLSLEVGFQIRNAPPYVELVKRVHSGALGDIGLGQAYYFCPDLAVSAPAGTPASQRRIRTWLLDRVLSGDIIVEQNIHVIDMCNWMLQGHPVKAMGVGGRRGRRDEGTAFGHYSVSYWYPNDIHVSLTSKQMGSGSFDAGVRLFGSRGTSEAPYSGQLGISGQEPWSWAAGAKGGATGQFSVTGAFTDNLAEADSEKHKSFIESITSGKFHNQAVQGVESSLSAMLGRKAAYDGRAVTWEELLASTESWDAGIDLDKLV